MVGAGRTGWCDVTETGDTDRKDGPEGPEAKKKKLFDLATVRGWIEAGGALVGVVGAAVGIYLQVAPVKKPSAPKPAEAPLAKTRPAGDRKIVVVLDPGHGGIDPGARYQGYEEAALMLSLARELKEKLILSGRYEVHLTRDEDVFLSLQGRVSAARAAAADIFISLHADALAVGNASGATVYTLSEHASDLAAAALAEGHDRADLLAGVDLGEQDDLVATVLMDMARIETMPRSEKLADAIVQGIAESVGKIRSRPRLSAGFSVLKAPDIPSVLIEFGFMSNAVDLANLKTAKWRAQVIDGLLQAIDTWARNDAAEARLLRQ